MAVVTRIAAVGAVGAMPLTAWALAQAALGVWREQAGPWTVEDLVAVGVSAAGAAVAAYLSLAAGGMVLGAIARGGRAIPEAMAAIAPETWRRVTAAALGISIAGGTAGPALAATPAPDHTVAAAVGWAPPAGPAETDPAPTEAHLAWAGAPALPQPVRDEASTAPASAPTVTVAAGDCLWDIAARLLGPDADTASVARAWPELYEANRDIIGGNPDLIQPGQVLTVPAQVRS